MNSLPLFKSHYSIGRSILTLNDKIQEDSGPDSIIEICKSNKLKNLFLVEDNMSSFLEAYTNCKIHGIKLCYGLRISITEDIKNNTEESLYKTSKIIIFAKNNNGYYKLIKIFTTAAREGFYYIPRIDYKNLKALWSEEDLILAIPFYDSFLFNNILKNFVCVPCFDFTNPLFFIENNRLPFDKMIASKVNEYAKKNRCATLNAKSIFYKNPKDFKSYLTLRCINNRSFLNKPEIEHLSSDQFSFSSWKDYEYKN